MQRSTDEWKAYAGAQLRAERTRYPNDERMLADAGGNSVSRLSSLENCSGPRPAASGGRKPSHMYSVEVCSLHRFVW